MRIPPLAVTSPEPEMLPPLRVVSPLIVMSAVLVRSLLFVSVVMVKALVPKLATETPLRFTVAMVPAEPGKAVVKLSVPPSAIVNAVPIESTVPPIFTVPS